MSPRVRKEEWDWSSIIESVLEVASGNAHNRQLNETLKLLVELSAPTQPQLSEEIVRVLPVFYQQQLALYTLTQERGNILTLLGWEEEPDPRELAWEDTRELIRTLTGDSALDRQRRNLLIDQAIANLTSVIQENSLRGEDGRRLQEVLRFLQGQLGEQGR